MRVGKPQRARWLRVEIPQESTARLGPLMSSKRGREAQILRNVVGVVVVLLVMGAVIVGESDASIIIMQNSTVFSDGAVAPDGPPPYAISEFDDDDTPGTVTLTISVSDFVGDADLTQFYYNLDPALDPTLLVISRISGDGPTAANTTIGTGVDLFKADGDGLYDILFDFPPPPGNDSALFNAGEEVVYEISGIPTLVATSFNFFSTPDGGEGPYVSATHFQSTGSGGQDSAWVGSGPGEGPIIPEPSSFALAAILVGIGSFLRRRR